MKAWQKDVGALPLNAGEWAGAGTGCSWPGCCSPRWDREQAASVFKDVI